MGVQKKTKKLIGHIWELLFSYIKKQARVLWSLFFGFLIYFISRALIFAHDPIFGYLYLGEAVLGSLTFLLLYFFGSRIIRFIGAWVSSMVENTLYRILRDFWVAQTDRLVDTLRRENFKERLKRKQEDAMNLPPVASVVLDTSTIIDGRILGVIETGFMDALLIVPQNVIDELQYMADRDNKLKRQKGRRGLDMLKSLRKAVGKKKFKIVDLKTSPEDVDKSLVKYCKKHKSKIATVDFNLNKAAQVAGVKVLNVNQLANEVKTNLIPGEVMFTKLVQEGKEDDQAVAFLDDGTMIVVKDGKSFIGEYKEVVVKKVLQTSAGKMIFAELLM